MVDFNNTPASGSAFTSATTFDAGLRAQMIRIYNTTAAGLAISGIVAYLVATIKPLLMIVMNPVSQLILFIALIAMAFMGFGRSRYSYNNVAMNVSAATLQTRYYIFTVLLGLTLAPIFIAYSGESITRVFFITAGMFAASSLVGYTTKRDLMGMGSFMIMGLTGVIIAMFVNFFLHSSALAFVLSVLCVIIFTGLIAFESQAAKRTYSQANDEETNRKFAVMHSLGLYLNFINLFTTLLNLFGNRR